MYIVHTCMLANTCACKFFCKQFQNLIFSSCVRSEFSCSKHKTIMKLCGSIVVIICCFLLQSLNLIQKRYTFSLEDTFNNKIVVCTQGLMFLIYPLLGYLADVYVTKYRTLKCGLVILATGVITCILVLLIGIFLHIRIGKEGR